MNPNGHLDPGFLEYMRQMSLQQNFPVFNQSQNNSYDPSSDIQIDINNKKNVRKEIVIFKVAEQKKNTVNYRSADYYAVQEILTSIDASLNIKLVRRLGKYSATAARPRRILVLFNGEQDQKGAVRNAYKLQNFPELQHISIKAYRPPDKRDDDENKSQNVKKDKPEKHDSEIPKNPFVNFASKTNNHKEINILVIGASGVGKSTWINGLANYMNFNTFEDALDAETPKCLIPMKFDFVVGDQNEEINVTMKASYGEEDMNEGKQAPGQSCTQQPKVYRFVTNSYSFNLIDTPGICDTRGVEYDIENIKMVMECLSEWEEIHGVCLLLKPKETRLVLALHYCLEELLVNLHKHAIPNITVVFTNSSGSFYRPGETLTLLHELVENVKAATQNIIRIDDENTFCIENEPVRLLYKKYNDVEIDDDEIERANESWKHTVAETYRMFKHFSELDPHSAEETKATSKVRGVITQLLTIMDEMNNEIVQNKRIHDEQSQQLKALETAFAQRQNNIYQGEYLEKTTLSSPVTVCCGQNCTETILSSKTNTPEIHYKKICCSPCPVKNVPSNQSGHVNLRTCTAFGATATCKSCGCSWQAHMHILYSQKRVTGQFTNISSSSGNEHLKIQITAKQNYIQQLKSKIDSLEKNYQTTLELFCPFLDFLSKNSIILYNSRFKDYVELEILNITTTAQVGDDRTKLNKLQKLLTIAEQQNFLVSEKNAKASQNVTMENYLENIKTLSNHDVVGPLLNNSFGYQRLFESLNFKMIRCSTKIKITEKSEKKPRKLKN